MVKKHKNDVREEPEEQAVVQDVCLSLPPQDTIQFFVDNSYIPLNPTYVPPTPTMGTVVKNLFLPSPENAGSIGYMWVFTAGLITAVTSSIVIFTTGMTGYLFLALFVGITLVFMAALPIEHHRDNVGVNPLTCPRPRTYTCLSARTTMRVNKTIRKGVEYLITTRDPWPDIVSHYHDSVTCLELMERGRKKLTQKEKTTLRTILNGNLHLLDEALRRETRRDTPDKTPDVEDTTHMILSSDVEVLEATWEAKKKMLHDPPQK